MFDSCRIHIDGAIIYEIISNPILYLFHMKVIIAENRLNDFILKYIEEKYPVDEINHTEGYDDLGNPDDSSYTFYVGDYDDAETLFRWYSKDYWEGPDESTVDYRIKQSPLLAFEDSRDAEKFDSLFNEYWKPVFKQWFYDNFGLEVKTII